MRIAAVLALLLAAAPTASAGRFTLGVSVARRDDRPTRSPGVFGELRVTHRLSLQVEMSRDSQPDAPNSSTMTSQRLGGAAVVDVGGDGGRITPFLLGGLTVEKTTSSWSVTQTRAAEVGAGLAATFAGDLVVSLDARIGQQKNTSVGGAGVYLANGDYGVPSDGRYTALRLGVGVNF